MYPYAPSVRLGQRMIVTTPVPIAAPLAAGPSIVAPVTPVFPLTAVAPTPPSSMSGQDALMTLLGLAWTAAGTWVGIRVGSRESGLVGVAGWVGGVGSALAGVTILGAALTGKRVMSPLDLFR